MLVMRRTMQMQLAVLPGLERHDLAGLDARFFALQVANAEASGLSSSSDHSLRATGQWRSSRPGSVLSGGRGRDR